MLKKLLVTLASILTVAGAATAVPAHASTSQESVFQDDTALIFSGDAKRQETLDEIKSLGATTVHTLVFWNRIAPDPNSRTKPAGFDATNPAAYPAGTWDPYDALVAEAHARGLDIIFSPVQGPTWADTCHTRHQAHHCKPSAREYGDFVAALGKRYTSVHRWSAWNEPNQSNWLYPQQQRKHHHNIPTAAIVYRNLFRAMTDALRSTGHARDQFLLGETAPLGRTSGKLSKRFLSPVAFFQGVFCLNRHGHKLHGRKARDSGCRHYKRLAATGISHHPYNRGGSQPPTRRPSGPGEVTIANLGRLSRVINQGAHYRRIKGRLPFYFTEFGFQSKPPEHFFGVSLSRQAVYINQSDYIAYRNRRVRAVSQYELFDDSDLHAFQTGLRFKNGKKKPALDAYRLPIWVTARHGRISIWGQVRPADGARQTVHIQNGNHKFRTVKTVHTNSHGYFRTRLSRRGGHRWRFTWTSPDGTTYKSRKGKP